MIIWAVKIFLYSSSMCSCYLFLISCASVRPIPFLSFIVPIFAWNIPSVSLIFLMRSLVFPILLFSSISLHWSLRKAFLFLLALWNSAFKWVYLSFSRLPFTSLLFAAICKASSDNVGSYYHFLNCSVFFFFSIGLSHLLCFLPREVPLALVVKLIWWCWILLTFACLERFWFLHQIWRRVWLGRVFLVVGSSLSPL